MHWVAEVDPNQSQSRYGRFGLALVEHHEPYRNPKNCVWAADPTGRAVLWARADQAIMESVRQPINGIVWAKIDGI